MSRFDFIKKKDATLYECCLQVEKRQYDDADILMLKCRRALECIVSIIGCRGRNLHQKVNDINNNISIPQNMKQKILAFKDICNENIHYSTTDKNIEQDEVLNILDDICHWIIDAIIDKQVNTLITDNVSVLEEKTRELNDAFKRNDFEVVIKLTDEIKRLSQKQSKDIDIIRDESINKEETLSVLPKNTKRFSVVVVGDISRGKSTFVNAIIGESIIPAGKAQMTVIPSKIVYGQELKYKLFYKNGYEESISKQKFESIKYTNIKCYDCFQSIKYAEISYPLNPALSNIEIIDTPSFSYFCLNEFLKNADVVILTLSACQPLTRVEYDFIVDHLELKNLFICITFKDELGGENGLEYKLKRYILDHLRDVGDFSKRIFIVSSWQALLFRRKEKGVILKGKQLLHCPSTLKETGILEIEAVLNDLILNWQKKMIGNIKTSL